ncbi:zinc finger protein 593-like [Strongylocentrotus purpuratus]|uniref:C2H2-type domain-containing protein n=1 Tax=Strongylocentrotus purpuratus TaxID=7668 RepID=A0A7M7P5Y7_STRPU|nr:zinc finger protein 593-like [Strongylocentrotus purpuratus]
MTRQARKRHHKGYTHIKKKYRTKRKTKDLDEIDEDLKPQHAAKLLHQKVDFDKPGSAQHYCLHCARYFVDEGAMKAHFRQKTHKRRLKALEMEPYTQKEAEAAAGMGSYIQPKKRAMITQQPTQQPTQQDVTMNDEAKDQT